MFEGGQLRGALRLRRAQQKQAAIDYRRTVLNAWKEIDDALTAYNADQNQRARLADAVAQNKIAVATAQTQYAQGAADFLNVLNADDALLASQSALVQATTEHGCRDRADLHRTRRRLGEHVPGIALKDRVTPSKGGITGCAMLRAQTGGKGQND